MKRIDDREKYKYFTDKYLKQLLQNISEILPKFHILLCLKVKHLILTLIVSIDPLGESEYENLLQTFVREQRSTILTEDDLCVIKNKINMGRKNGTVSIFFF